MHLRRGEGWRPWAATRSEQGMVTAELAVALPALVAVALVLLWAIGLGAHQVLAVQAAREGARAAARGAGASAVRVAAQQVLPAGTVQLDRHGSAVTVTVRTRPRAALRILQPFQRSLSASATAWVEQP